MSKGSERRNEDARRVNKNWGAVKWAQTISNRQWRNFSRSLTNGLEHQMTYELEAIGKANPKSSSVGEEGFSTSKPLIGVMDRVAALKYIKGPFKELKTEYAFDKFMHLRTGSTLNKLARSYVVRKAIRENWRLSKDEAKEIIYLMAYAAIDEAVMGAKKPMSIMRLSEKIGVSERRSRDYWLSRYRILVDDFLLFDFEASKAIKRLTMS